MTIGTHASPPICAPISLRRATMIKPSPLVSTPSPLPWLSGTSPLNVELNFRLGQVYHAIGAYHRAMACLRCNVESLTGELLYARFGQALVSVFSRAWLVWCLAEVGEFDEGLARGEEGIQVAEAVDQPFSLIAAYYSVGSPHRQGDFHKAIPVRNEILRSARLRTIGSSSRGWPQVWASPWPIVGLSPQHSHSLSKRSSRLPPCARC